MSGRSVILKDEGGFTANVDSTGAQLITQYADVALNAGTAYMATAVKASVANNGTLDLLAKVPLDVLTYALASGSAASDIQVQFFEGTTVSADGAAANVISRNRLTPGTSVVAVSVDPTVTDLGTLLLETVVGGGRTRSYGTSFQTDDEIILDTDQQYLIRITNISGSGGVTLSVVLSWFEFTDPAELRV